MLATPLFKRVFILLIIVGILNFVGNKFYLFWYLHYYDTLVHFLAGGVVSMAYLQLFYFRKSVDNTQKNKIILLAVLGAFIVGVLWEIFELTYGITTFADGIHYVTDTSSDLLADVSGGFFAAMYGFRFLNIQNN